MFCKAAVPVFNRPDLDRVFQVPLTLDKNQLLLSTEFVALEGTRIELVEKGTCAWEVDIDTYPSEKKLYVPKWANITPHRVRQLEMPPKTEIVATLRGMVGCKYIWGGNYARGVTQLLTQFPPEKELSDENRKIWMLQGVDCSGLLFEATNGHTPRNTRELARFGSPVACDDLLQPLDLIVWPGHVVVVLDKTHTIESRAEAGCVYISPLKERLVAARQEAPHLTLRRWI